MIEKTRQTVGRHLAFTAFVLGVVVVALLALQYAPNVAKNAFADCDATDQCRRIADGDSDTVNEHGACRIVTNNLPADLMVPYGSAAEWSGAAGFINTHPPGTTVVACGGGGSCTPGANCGNYVHHHHQPSYASACLSSHWASSFPRCEIDQEIAGSNGTRYACDHTHIRTYNSACSCVTTGYSGASTHTDGSGFCLSELSG